MMPNLLVLFLTALIPLFLGALWYSKILFGNAWMTASGMTDEKVKSGNMLVIFGLTYVFGVMISFILFGIVVHQAAIASLFMGEAGFMEQMAAQEGAVYEDYMAIMSRFEDSFRTFKHGMLHGFITGLFVALPITAIIAIFERRSFKYIAIHAGYWIIALMLMGGVLCQWA
jgi:hypothetical protein